MVLLFLAPALLGAGWEGRVWGQEQWKGRSLLQSNSSCSSVCLRKTGRDSTAALRLSSMLSDPPLALHPSPALLPTPSSPFSPHVFILTGMQLSHTVTPCALLPHCKYRWRQQEPGQAEMGRSWGSHPNVEGPGSTTLAPVRLRWEAKERQFAEEGEECF